MDTIDRFLAGVTDPAAADPDVLAEDVVYDATTPGWRETVRGRRAVSALLSGWFADPGTFEALTRTAIPGGELVEFTLNWVEEGIPHQCHQAHIVTVDGDRIVKDVAFCGGRWSAARLAQMAAHDA